MTKILYCKCPKCGERCHNYLLEDKATRSIRCYECGIGFTVKVDDFKDTIKGSW